MLGYGPDPSLGSQPTGDIVMDPTAGCPYFLPGALLSEPESIISLWPVQNYTAWRQRHMCVCERVDQSCYLMVEWPEIKLMISQ